MTSNKDKQQKLQEKYQAILSGMLREEDNKYCVDCDAKGPRWASWNLGVFLCIRCAGIHRNLGVHISRVKSVNLDTWTAEQIASMQAMGNSKARAIYEANLPDNFRRSQNDSAMETFIRNKYEMKKWIAKEWSPQKVQIPPELVEDESSKEKGKPTSVKKLDTKVKLSPSVSKAKEPLPDNKKEAEKPAPEKKIENNSTLLLDFDQKTDFFNSTTEVTNQHSNEPNLFENFNESLLFDSIPPISSAAQNQTSPPPQPLTTTSQTTGSNSLGDMDLLKDLSISSGDLFNSTKINKESILGLYNSGLQNNVNKLGNMPINTQPTNNIFNLPSNVNMLNQPTGTPLTHSQSNPFGIHNAAGAFGPTGTFNKPNSHMTHQPYNSGASNDIFGNLNKFAQPTKPAFNQNADLNSIFANNLNAFQNQNKSHAHIQPTSTTANIFSMNTQPSTTNANNVVNNDLVSLWD